MSYTEIWCTPELLSTEVYYERLAELHLELPEATTEQLKNALNQRCEMERLKCKRILDFVFPAPLYVCIDADSETGDEFIIIRPLPSRNLNECRQEPPLNR